MDRKLNVRKMALMSLRMAKQRAAQQQFKEKEKSKSIPSAMRISWTIEKIVWNMISDGQTFAEAEISSMVSNLKDGKHGERMILHVSLIQKIFLHLSIACSITF
jgi:hypothetical protein